MKIQSWAIGLGGLLGLCAVVLLFSKSEQSSFPSAGNLGPSGTAALVRLLERDGYQVRADRSPFLPTQKGDLVIAPVIGDEGRSLLDVLSGSEVTPIQRALARHAASGGKVLLIQVPGDFNSATRGMIEYSVTTPSGTKTIQAPRYWGSPEMLKPYEAPGRTSLPFTPSEPAAFLSPNSDSAQANSPLSAIARIQRMGEGSAVSLDAGTLAINRHLADAENADVVTDLVRMMAKPGSQIVMAEAAFGNASEQGLGAALGSWFTAARNQALILAVVICVTLGVRFGRVLPARRRVRGAREMVDALATQLSSSRDKVFMLRCFAHQIETEIKRLEGLPASSETTALLRVIPGVEREPISAVLSLPADAKLTSSEAVVYAQQLEGALSAAKQRAKERSLRPAS